MDKYYYLASQLPRLDFAKAAPLDSSDFLDEASKWVSAQEMKIFFNIKDNIFGDNEKRLPAPVKECFDLFMQLNEDITAWRRAKNKGSNYSLHILQAGIFNNGNPLDIEKNILMFKWKFIEEKEPGHYFDFSFLVFYFFKLLIIEKLNIFNKEAGEKVFKKACEVKYG